MVRRGHTSAVLLLWIQTIWFLGNTEKLVRMKCGFVWAFPPTNIVLFFWSIVHMNILIVIKTVDHFSVHFYISFCCCCYHKCLPDNIWNWTNYFAVWSNDYYRKKTCLYENLTRIFIAYKLSSSGFQKLVKLIKSSESKTICLSATQYNQL